MSIITHSILTLLKYFTYVNFYWWWNICSFHISSFHFISETYLDSSTSNDDDNLLIPSYNLFTAYHPSNTKQGSVCIYYRNPLPLKILGFQYLQECINKLCRFVSLYRLPSQSQDDFEAFVNNFELNLDVVAANNTFLTVVLGDF